MFQSQSIATWLFAKWLIAAWAITTWSFVTRGQSQRGQLQRVGNHNVGNRNVVNSNVINCNVINRNCGQSQRGQMDITQIVESDQKCSEQLHLKYEKIYFTFALRRSFFPLTQYTVGHFTGSTQISPSVRQIQKNSSDKTCSGQWGSSF